jgi:hypothetical protein
VGKHTGKDDLSLDCSCCVWELSIVTDSPKFVRTSNPIEIGSAHYYVGGPFSRPVNEAIQTRALGDSWPTVTCPRAFQEIERNFWPASPLDKNVVGRKVVLDWYFCQLAVDRCADRIKALPQGITGLARLSLRPCSPCGAVCIGR